MSQKFFRISKLVPEIKIRTMDENLLLYYALHLDCSNISCRRWERLARYWPSTSWRTSRYKSTNKLENSYYFLINMYKLSQLNSVSKNKKNIQNQKAPNEVHVHVNCSIRQLDNPITEKRNLLHVPVDTCTQWRIS